MAFIFDGPNKLINLSLGTTVCDVKEMYSSWKSWLLTADNLKFLPAFKVIGGDPTTGGNAITPYFFLDNGWKVRPQEANHTLTVNGILLTVDDSDPFSDTLGNWRVKVKSVVPIYAENTSATITGDVNIDTTQIASDIWNYSNRALTNKDANIIQVAGNTVSNISDFRANISSIPGDVWSYVSRELTVTAGLSPAQEAKIDSIISKLATTLDANIKSVQGTAVSDISDFNSGAAAEIDYGIVASSVWSYVSRELTVAAGLSPAQETTLNNILNKLSTTLDANIKSVQGTSVTSVNDFKADLSNISVNLSPDFESKVDAIKAKTDKLTFDLSNHLLSYIEDKSGFSLTSDERTAIANVVEQEIISETDSEKVLQAITDKIAAINPDLGGLTTSAIASAVWNYVTRSLTVASGLTTDQNAKLDDIFNDVNLMPYNIWNYATRGLTTGVNITAVNGTSVSNITDFRNDLSGVMTGISNIPSNVWSYIGPREVTNDVTLDPAAVWAYPTRSLTDKSANITQVNGSNVSINDFKNDLSGIPLAVWTHASRNVTNMLNASDIWNFTTRKLTENNSNIVSVNGISVTGPNDFKAEVNIPSVDLTGIPQAVWEYTTRITQSSNELTPAMIWNYSNRSLNGTVDANILKVNGNNVTIDDFKEEPVSLNIDNAAIANAVWNFASRDVNVKSVNGITVTGPDDFKASVPDIDLSGIPFAVWNYSNRDVTNALISAADVWSYSNRSLTNKDANIKSVNGVNVTSVNDFKADLTNVIASVDASEIWNYTDRSLTTYPSTLSASEVWSHPSRVLTDRSVNVTQVNGTSVNNINDFKTDISLVPAQVWSYASRTFTNSLSIPTAAEIWNYNTRSLTNSDVNVIKVNGTVVNGLNDFKADVSNIVAEINQIPSEVWAYSLRTTTEGLSARDVWNYSGRSLTEPVNLPTNITNKINSLPSSSDIVNANIVKVAGEAVLDIDDFKPYIPGTSDISNAVWSNINRTLTGEVNLPTSIITKINTLNNFDETELSMKIDALPTSDDINALSSKLDSKPSLANIESSLVLAKKSDVDILGAIVNGIPSLSEIRDEMINIQFGGLEISNNQMTIKDKDGAVIAIFNLKDAQGNPTMTTVYKREVVQ